MNWVLSLAKSIEGAGPTSTTNNLTGEILDFAALVAAENLERLDAHHELYALFLFHPAIDRPVADYLRSGALATDSGDRILALFTFDEAAYVPRPLGEHAFSSWLKVEHAEFPLLDLTRLLLPDLSDLRLPGLLFLESLSRPGEPLFVPMAGWKTDEVVGRCRAVFAAARFAVKAAGSRDRAIPLLVEALGQRGIDYVRGGRRSAGEWLREFWSTLRRLRRDLVSIFTALL